MICDSNTLAKLTSQHFHGTPDDLEDMIRVSLRTETARTEPAASCTPDFPQADEKSSRMPRPQDNLQRAETLAFDALDHQTAAQMLWLGAHSAGTARRLPVLNHTLQVDVAARRITTSTG